MAGLPELIVRQFRKDLHDWFANCTFQWLNVLGRLVVRVNLCTLILGYLP